MMGEKGFSQSGWRETNHQLNLQKKPTSSVLKPRRKGGMWCFRMLLLGDSFDTRWEKQAARLGFFPDICWHLHIDFAGENCRNGISKLESLFYGITFKPLSYFLNFLECPIMTWKTIFDDQICEAPICQGRDFAAHRHLALQMVLLSAALSRRWAPKRSLCMKWNGTPLNGLSKKVGDLGD